MLKSFEGKVSHKVLVFWINGTQSVYNYVDEVEYVNGAVILHGQDQTDGKMVRRTNVITLTAAANIEVRSIKV